MTDLYFVDVCKAGVMIITDAKEAYLKIRNLIEDNYSRRCYVKLILSAPVCEIKNGEIYQIFHPYGKDEKWNWDFVHQRFVNAFANTFSDSFISDGMYYLPDDSTRLIRANSFVINIDDFLAGLLNGILDGAEKVTQLNRPISNQLSEEIETLTKQLYTELNLTEDILKTSASSCLEFAELNVPLHSIKIRINKDRIINSIRPFINSNDILEKRIRAVVYCEKEPMFMLN